MMTTTHGGPVIKAAVIVAMAAVFALGASAAIDASPDEQVVYHAAGQPLLTEAMIGELADSLETVLGVTLAAAQRAELHAQVTRAWRTHDERVTRAVVASIDEWRQARELPSDELAAWATRGRPEVVGRLRLVVRGGGGGGGGPSAGGEVEQWMLTSADDALVE